jgi:Zn-dependent protease with chaperone function
MQTDWEGFYLDGRTAARQRARARLMRSGIEVSTEGGLTFLWPYDQVRQTQGFYAGEQVRLEKGGEIAEALLISDAAFLTALHEVAPGLSTRFHDPARRRTRVELTLLAALAVIGIALALYQWGIPLLAAFVAPRVPIAWEERLGLTAIESLAPPAKRCEDQELRAAIDDVLKTLTAPLPSHPFTLRVIVVNDSTVNALAVPGGSVVVFRGLLKRTRTPEEFAGVLAHEVQHVLQRHVMRVLLQHASTGLLVVALTGDVSGAMAYGLEAARTLGTLQYSRVAEEEADREGVRMLLVANVDPEGTITFLEGLKRKEEDPAGLLRYLSTHPTTADRIERLRSLTGPPGRPSIKLLPGSDWTALRERC